MNRMNYWQDKVVLVTGGSSGLGRVIAEAFLGAGAKVAIAGLEAEAVEPAGASCWPAGCDALGVQADITAAGRRRPAVRRRRSDRFGRLDVLVNNAGRSMRGKVLDTTPEQFRELMELNLIALVRCTRAALPHLLARRGHVVNIGSLAAKSASRWVGRLSGQQVRRGRLLAAIAAGAGPAKGCTCCWSAPARSRARTSGSIRWKGSKTCPSVPGGPGRACGCGRSRRSGWPRRSSGRASAGKPELVVPGAARLLFALAQLWPALGDWLVLRMT